MFAILFSVLVLTAFVSLYSNIAMRVRLTKREPSRDKLVWWRASSDEVTSSYEELFPRSYLPILSQFAFWLVVTSAAAVLVAVLWTSK